MLRLKVLAMLALCSVTMTGCRAPAELPQVTPATNPTTAPAVPAISETGPTSIQNAIDFAIAQKLPTLVIPPGTYEVASGQPAGKRNFHLRVTGAKDLEIIATGVTLVFPDRYQHSLGFFDCTNVTFRGATIKRKTKSISQGTIEAIRDGGKSIDVRIDKGYPTDIDNRGLFDTFWCSVYTMDRTRWLGGYRAATPPVMEKIEPDLFRVAMVESAKQIGIDLQVGQPLVWRGMVFDDVRVMRCENMKLLDITVAGGAGMCFHEYGGANNLYQRCKITYGDLPAGATQKPMQSGSADGFHSSDARKGATIEDCDFEGLGDDAIAIHGFYGCLVESDGNRAIVWRDTNAITPTFARPGDPLRFIDADGKPRGEAKVVAAREVPDYKPKAGYQPNKLYRFFSRVEGAKFVELQLDQPITGEPNWLVSNAGETGSGYVIRNCRIRNCTARGAMVKGSDGLIEGCTFENIGRAAIEFMPEHIIWPESDYARNVIVRNNVIRNVSLNRQENFLRHPGSIAIYAFRTGTAGYIGGGGHKNILIENNTFEDNDGLNLLISTADGVTVRNNRFVRPLKVASPLGVGRGVKSGALVWITQADHVTLENNVVIDPGRALKSLVSTTDTAHGIGFETGVRIVTPPTQP